MKNLEEASKEKLLSSLAENQRWIVRYETELFELCLNGNRASRWMEKLGELKLMISSLREMQKILGDQYIKLAPETFDDEPLLIYMPKSKSAWRISDLNVYIMDWYIDKITGIARPGVIP